VSASGSARAGSEHAGGRRAFIAGLGGLLAAPAISLAQTPSRIPRIGYLSVGSASDPRRAALLDAFRQGLRDLGYVENKNIRIEARFAEGTYERLPTLAAELVGLAPDVIVAYSTPATRAVRDATKAIPIVMSAVVDPVATGLVAGLGRPGGNVTGLSLMSPEIIGKQIQLLMELIPKLSRVAILWNPSNPSNAPQLREAELAAQTLRVQLQPLEARDGHALDGAFVAMTRERAGALVVLVDGLLVDHRVAIARLAAKTRVPAVYGLREHVEAGGFMFYGASTAESNRRAAVFVDKILRGARPGGLPVEQPTKFELIINRGIAKALGLVIPQPILVRADEIFE
jgi:putative ABC transport system substrate-binding protein